ncbi:TlpA disulfide reductase family protein [Chitinophaga pollutisoli]|uniref:TlpA disulfide reductase family protein n=1 Tax=Chitinophaga pollutisoli TaxID=3133966 RepID=A0ABZ2YSN0_9BACT
MSTCFFIWSLWMATAVTRVSPAELEARLARTDSPMVVNLWATWCAPCVEELPYFEKAAKQNPGIQFVYLSLDLDEAYPHQIESFVSKLGLSGEVWWMEESNANKYAPLIDAQWKGSLPATLFIHPGKKYRKFIQGAMDEGAVMKEVAALRD